MVLFPGLARHLSTAVEAVGAYPLLGEADTLDKIFYLAEFQRCKTQSAGYFIDHALIFGCAGGGILLESRRGITLQVADDSACDKLHVALGVGKGDVGTSIHQRRAGDASMHRASSALEEDIHVVTKLRAMHYRVVAEDHVASLEHRSIGDQFHLCHQRSSIL